MQLQRLRDDRGWTQEQLAERVGASRRSVQAWESGVVPLPVYQRLLADVFRVPLAELGFEKVTA